MNKIYDNAKSIGSKLFTAPLIIQKSRHPADEPVKITAADLRSIVWGFGLTASGGGGALIDGIDLAEALITDGFDHLIAQPTANASSDEMLVMPGGMGAPSAIAGNIVDFVPACLAAIEILDKNGKLGRPIKGLLPVEAGPVNGLLALYIAYKSAGKYTIYNCDGAGRAVPSLTNLLYNYQDDVTFSPAGVADIHGENAAVHTGWGDGLEGEKGLRPVIASLGGAVGLAAWPQSGAETAGADLNVTTFSDAIAIGEHLRKHAGSAKKLKEYLKRVAPSRKFKSLVWTATFDEISIDPAGREQGYDKGYIVFGRDSIEDNVEYRIYFLNENLFISRHDSTSKEFLSYVATAPSIIAGFYSDPEPPPFLGVGANAMVPYNTGDNNKIETLVGREVVVVVTPPSAKSLYRQDLKESFVTVLNSYFNDYGFEFDIDDIIPER